MECKECNDHRLQGPQAHRLVSQLHSQLKRIANLSGHSFRNMRLNGDNFTIKDTFIDAETTGGFPFNTDGFDVA